MRRRIALRPTRAAAAAAFLAFTTFGAITRADIVPIDVIARGQNRLIIDGVVGDWRRFAELLAVDDPAQVLAGRPEWHGADDASFGFALARDDQALYLAFEVHDDAVMRTRGHGAGDDAVLLALAVTAGTRTVAYDLEVYPGDPGRYGGAVRFRGGRAIAGAQVVEAPLRSGSGFTIEAAIPWRAMPEINANIASLRGRLAYRDCDPRTGIVVDTVMATGPGDGEHPAQLPPAAGSAGQTAAQMIEEFQRTHDLVGAQPLLDRAANVAGDAALERVVIFPRYAMAMGPGIAGGTRYAFVEFPARSREDVLEPSLRDVTGDGRVEIVLRVRQPPQDGLTREVLYVFGAPHGGDQLARLFAHELGRTQGDRYVRSRATYDSGPRVRLTFEGAGGYTPQNYPRVVEPGVLPPMTPWSDWRVEVYRWNDSGQRFELDHSEPNPNAARGGATAPIASNAPSAASPAMAQAPDLNAVMQVFRRERGIAENVRPNFAAQANVAGDASPESVQIFGRHLVVSGSRFQNGRSFYTVELPAAADADVLGLTMADVTGEGRAEAVVRVRRASQVQVRGRPLDLIKEYLLVYSLEDGHRGRVFAAEVSRRVGTDVITNVVRPVPPGRSNDALVIEAGRTVGGWNEQTYPFHDIPVQGFAPLLLPWDAAARRVVYRWNGSALAPAQ